MAANEQQRRRCRRKTKTIMQSSPPTRYALKSPSLCHARLMTCRHTASTIDLSWEQRLEQLLYPVVPVLPRIDHACRRYGAAGHFTNKTNQVIPVIAALLAMSKTNHFSPFIVRDRNICYLSSPSFFKSTTLQRRRQQTSTSTSLGRIQSLLAW